MQSHEKLTEMFLVAGLRIRFIWTVWNGYVRSTHSHCVVDQALDSDSLNASSSSGNRPPHQSPLILYLFLP